MLIPFNIFQYSHVETIKGTLILRQFIHLTFLKKEKKRKNSVPD